VDSKEIKASTLRNNIKPIKLFLEQIDIDIPWKRLTRGMPRERKYANDRAPKLEEIIRIRVSELNQLFIPWFPQECG